MTEEYPFSLIFIWGTAKEKQAFREQQRTEFEQALERKWQ